MPIIEKHDAPVIDKKSAEPAKKPIIEEKKEVVPPPNVSPLEVKKENESPKEKQMPEKKPEEVKELAKPLVQKEPEPPKEETKAFPSEIKQEGRTLQRKNSKFDIQKSDKMFRPEFMYGEGKIALNEKMWELMKSYLGSDMKSIQRQIVNHIEYTLARTRFNFDKNGCYYATAYSVRDRLVESWNDTNQHMHEQDPKRIYYMSLEYLLGRCSKIHS